VKRVVLLMAACAAALPAVALDRNRPPCPATEVAPGVKMRTGACPMMFLPAEQDTSRDTFARPSDVPGPWSRAAEPQLAPAMPVRQTDTVIRP
jgi:hypothetical protein